MRDRILDLVEMGEGKLEGWIPKAQKSSETSLMGMGVAHPGPSSSADC